MLIIGFQLFGSGYLVAQQKDTLKTGVSSALDQAVKYSAADSMKFDMVKELVYLYDSAKVEYGDISLAAAYIIIDFKNNLVSAEGYKDSTGRYITDAEFVESGQTFHAKKMTYNYLTRKGKIIEISTQQGDSYILADAAKKDSSNTVYIWKGQYTTCDLDHPHFSIRTKKMKVIPDDKIVTGPAYLEIADVPTPLAVPFGFFPNKKGRASGILIPTYGESPQLGFFLKDGGYYWGINDKIDMAVRGDIYSKGSWGAKMFTNYRVRYKYSGNLALRYSQIHTGDRELPTRVKRNDFFINWTHVQDQKSNPSVRFSANVNAGTSTYNTFNANRPNDYLANTFQSNIAWSKSWKVGTLAANLRHNQNTVTRMMDMTLPQLAFTVNRFYPFRNPNRVESKWYDKIGISYVTEFQNSLNIADSLISINHPEYVRARLKTGIRQSLPVATSFNVLKYFTLSPSFTLNSVTQFRTIRKTWDNTTASIITDTVNGARINYDWNAALSFSTRIFGMYFPKHSRFSAIRHTATPALSLMYMPDFTDPKYGFYKSVQNNTSGGTVKYSIFEGGLYGSSLPGKIGALVFSLQNSLEGKLRPKNDSDQTSERRMLFDALNVAFSYNFMADNFNWSNISAGFRTKFFRKIDVNTSIIADPYKLNENGVRIEQFEWKDKKRIARLTTANLVLSTSLRKGGFTASSNRTSQRGTEQEMNMINANPNAYVDFNVPWSLNVMYNLSWSRPANIVSITQSIRFSGDVNVTPKWKVGFDSSYDLQLKKFGYTSLNVYRDLHCWEMQFNWIPFGFRQSYNITINVKSAVLQDLKLTRKRDWFDFAAQ